MDGYGAHDECETHSSIFYHFVPYGVAGAIAGPHRDKTTIHSHSETHYIIKYY